MALSGLKQQIALFMDKSRVLARVGELEIDFEEVSAFDEELKRLRTEQERYLSLRSGLYEDLKKGIITEDDFSSFREIYERQYQELERAVERQEKLIRDLFRSGITAGVKLERMKEALQLSEPDRMTLITFVSRVLVYEDKRVRLELRHGELFSKAVMLAGYVEARENRRREEAV